MKRMPWSAALLVLLPLSGAAAETPATPDLPPLPMVAAAIHAHPNVTGARAGIGYEEANRKRLVAGVHETTMRVGSQVRQDAIVNRSMREWDVTLERPLRLHGKSDLDSRLGEQGVEQARLAVGDARHETARLLLRQWFGWLRAAVQVGHWEKQKESLARQAAIVTRRAELGDAPKQEQSLAFAALAQADSALLQATLTQEVAVSELTSTFPQIRLPANPRLVEPQPLADKLDVWQARIAEHNHELAMARGEVKRRDTAAQRALADRMPDPSIGVRYASERAGADRIIGLVVSIPFAGTARQATSEAAVAQTGMAVQREAAVLRRLAAEAAATYTSATRSFDSWRQTRVAAEAMERNVQSAARAYQLGELSLTDLLTARRLAIEARVSATVVQLDAAEARYRLLLDAHRLWDLAED